MPSMLLMLALLTPSHAKGPKVLKALGAMMDPATGPRAALDAIRQQGPRLGPVDGALTFSTAVASTLPVFGAEERAALVGEAGALLDAAVVADPSRTAAVEAARGALLDAAGDAAGAEAAYRRSMAAGPSLAALVPLLDRVPAEAAALCAATRQTVADFDLGPLVETCNAHGDALAWASPADKEAWASWREQSAAAQAALDARHAAEAQALSASFSSTPAPAPTAAPAPSGPTVTSVSLSSSCRETVRVFFGDKPKFGSGTTTTISSHSVSSYSMRPGDMIWIVDQSDNGLSSTSVSGSSQRIEILESCTGFRIY